MLVQQPEEWHSMPAVEWFRAVTQSLSPQEVEPTLSVQKLPPLDATAGGASAAAAAGMHAAAEKGHPLFDQLRRD